MTQVRISGLIAATDRLHARLAAPEAPPRLGELLTTLQELVARTEALCAEAGVTPGALPVRSRRAYQWMVFLSDAEMLEAHAATVAQLRAALPEVAQLALLYTGALYRTRFADGAPDVVIHEGFVDAPANVLAALAEAALDRTATAARERVQAYARTDDFLEVVAALEAATEEARHRPQGRHVDLELVFDRVNAAYFDEKMARPNLTWSKRTTTRKMGHYNFVTDTVWISRTLDAPEVPPYVLDYIVYHELLHKQHGVRTRNGRRRLHTPAFRADERAFRDYERARAFLRRI
jgi:hypothetical protein